MSDKRVMIPKAGMNEDAAMDLRGQHEVMQEDMNTMILRVPESQAAAIAASNGGLVEMDE